MTRMIDFGGYRIITNVGTLRERIAKEDTSGRTRSKFVRSVRAKPWITQTTKNAKLGIIWRGPKQFVIW